MSDPEAPGGRERVLERPLAVVLLTGLSTLASAGLPGLFESTETRYAEVAREMLASGDWVVPRLNGLHHFHKPPFTYWATASGMALLGSNSWGARVPAMLASILTVALTAWIARRRFEGLGAPGGRAAWVLASMLLFAVLSRPLASDPFLTLSVAAFWALSPSSWALGALGIGFLIKGPVVFVHTALPILAAAAWGRDRRFLALLGPRRGWLAFALLALPWYLVVVARTPGLLGYFLGDQVWGRYATTSHHRAGPPWYFLVVLLAGALPWTFALVAGVRRAWGERAEPEARLLLCWLIAPTVFLSFSGSKLPAYLLPCLPAAAILAAREASSRSSRWGAGAALVALAVVGAMAGGRALGQAMGAASGIDLPPLALVACGLLLLAGLAAAWGRIAWTAALVVAAVASLWLAVPRFESALGSPRNVVRLMKEQRSSGEPVVEVGHFVAGVPFYLGQRVALHDVPRETGFEDEAQLARVVAPEDSIAVWAGRGRVWTFGVEARVQALARARGLRYVRIARWRKEAMGFLSAP